MERPSLSTEQAAKPKEVGALTAGEAERCENVSNRLTSM